jgi:hypothetical protein
MHFHVRHIEAYVHLHRIAVLVEFGLDDDLTGTMNTFRHFAHAVTLQIAATAPDSIDALLAQSDLQAPERTIGDMLSGVCSVLKSRVAILRFERWDTEPQEHPKNEPPEPPRAPANIIRLRSSER